jgi:hypothetical protein
VPNFAHAVTRRAREIIQDLENWTPTASARDESDRSDDVLCVGSPHQSSLLDIFGVGPLSDLVRANDYGHAQVLARLHKCRGHS